MNERIDHSNYEAWLLDRAEGSLSPEKEAELNAFLLANPDLEADISDLPTLSDEPPLAFPAKRAMHRSLPPTGTPDDAHIEDHLIAAMEGDLNEDQRKALTVFLRSSGKYDRLEKLYSMAHVDRTVAETIDRSGLYRSMPPKGMPDERSLEDFLVARSEGDLEPGQVQALDEILKNDPVAQRQLELIRASRIELEVIPYPYKEGLRKGGKVIPLFPLNWTVALRIAAMVTLLFSVAVWYMMRDPDQGVEVAVVPAPSVPSASNDQDANSPEEARDHEVAIPSKEMTGTIPILVDTATSGAVNNNTDGTEGRNHASERIDPVVRERIPMMASVIPALPARRIESSIALKAAGPAPEVEYAFYEDAMAYNSNKGVNWSEFLVGKLRKEVLATEQEDIRPLDIDDAVALVDKGLSGAGTRQAGLAVDRNAQGRFQGFHLRLGRDLEITARR